MPSYSSSLTRNGFLVIISSIILLLPLIRQAGENDVQNAIDTEAFWRDFSECTTGLAACCATPDGRPLLWKNRDVSISQQEYHYVDDGRIPYIALTYRDTVTNYYAGINEAGFAIENSDAHNLTGWGQAAEGRWGSGADDGKMMWHALATCRTVDDFRALLDTTNIIGRTHHSNYGTFDAFGCAVMFEAGSYRYNEFDANESPKGIIIRANYAYTGAGADDPLAYYGPHRHNRAMQLWTELQENCQLTPEMIYRHVVRDLVIPDFDPYPLPFEGYYGNYDYGCIPQDRAICRDRTRSVMIAQGVHPGDHPDRSVIWAMVGQPLGAVATPLWVRARSVPVEYDANGSRICNIACSLSDWVWGERDHVGVANTRCLVTGDGNGIWDYTIPLESWVFSKTHQFVNSPQFNPNQLTVFQNEIAQQVADSLAAWHPAFTHVTELAEPVRYSDSIVLRWGAPDWGEFDDGARHNCFRIYRNSHPFRDGEMGQLLCEVNRDYYVDDEPLEYGGYYRIEAVY